jgi:indolepyruvate ferredoxin oxidoreductase alpha subunit
MSGNEAIARGAWEAGCRVAAAYPGTPSTEILQFMTRYPEVDAQWSTNEKVALEVCAGAATAGARALAAMKHVGVNVAADPLFTLSYRGVKGGLVVVTADDPQIHSSQNEQDNRQYARAAKLPMLEPSDSDEGIRFTKIAFDMSEKWDCPVMVRTTTRISHGQSMAETGEREEGRVEIGVTRDVSKLVMLPAFALQRHHVVEERMDRLVEFAETFAENRIEGGDRSMGIISSGVAYQYAREAYPKASFLKLGMVWPLPKELFRKFADSVDRLYVVEELDPFIEEWVRGLGIEIIGKSVFPRVGEYSPSLIRKAVSGDAAQATDIRLDPELPARPPIMCPGCPHRGLFVALRDLDAFVCGDIGCYTLGSLPPLSAMHSNLCMGAGVGESFGIEKATGSHGKTAAVIGDSTFFHSGITPLLDMAYNQSRGTVIVLDNRTTAMTGRQDHPGSGRNLRGGEAPMADILKLAEGLGVKRVRTVDPYNLEQTRAAIKEELEAEQLSLVISKSPCMLIPASAELRRPPLQVDPARCTGCKTCLKVACPAMSFEKEPGEYVTREGKTKKRTGSSQIDELLCTGCGVCLQVCRFEAIRERN